MDVLLAKVVHHSSSAMHWVRKLCGFEGYAEKWQVIDTLSGGPRPSSATKATPETAPQLEPSAAAVAAGTALRSLVDDCLDGNLPASPPDPFAQATAIARSAAGEEIDWSREPLTEYERRLRAKFIERDLSRTLLCGWAIEAEVRALRRTRKPVASDLAAGLKRIAPTIAQRKLRDLRDAVDDDKAA